MNFIRKNKIMKERPCDEAKESLGPALSTKVGGH